VAAYERAVRRFVSWADGQGVDLPGIAPGTVGQYLVGLGGSLAIGNQHLAAFRGFFDRLVNRHVAILNPAASVNGVKDQVVEGQSPEIGVEQAGMLLRSVKITRDPRQWCGMSAGCSSPDLPRSVKRLTSHTRAVVSMAPEAKVLPSGANATE
jgi:hypothetical protein